jgi:membrane peptidoglycan carboxypeptidase
VEALQTTLDSRLQSIAEETVKKLAPELKQKFNAGNLALVAMKPATGEIVAYVGNIDNKETGAIDMAQVPRQPGSSFKPIVYAAAFQKGMKPDTVIRDAPLSIGADRPQNADGGFKGPMFMHHALGASRNIPAIRAFIMAGGEEPVINLASAMGATAPLSYRAEMQQDDPGFRYSWPMAIGAAEIPLVQMVQAYATLANDGVFRPAITIQKITDAKGALAYESPDLWNPKRVLNADIARSISNILANPDDRPGGWWRDRLNFSPGLAIKTGTSNLCFRRDKSGKCVSYGVNNTWAMGFTPDLAIGVWAGNADNTPMIGNADGLNVAVEVFKNFLVEAQKPAI